MLGVILKSTKKGLKIIKFVTYLKTPIGHAWAWHSKAKEVFVAFWKVLLLASIENVGGLEPIGSETLVKVCGLWLWIDKTYPITWMWKIITHEHFFFDSSKIISFVRLDGITTFDSLNLLKRSINLLKNSYWPCLSLTQ